MNFLVSWIEGCIKETWIESENLFLSLSDNLLLKIMKEGAIGFCVSGDNARSILAVGQATVLLSKPVQCNETCSTLAFFLVISPSAGKMVHVI